MKIKDVEIEAKNINEFCDEWKRQGHKVTSVEKDWIKLENNKGDKFECLILGDSIFPFKFDGCESK